MERFTATYEWQDILKRFENILIISGTYGKTRSEELQDFIEIQMTKFRTFFNIADKCNFSKFICSIESKSVWNLDYFNIKLSLTTPETATAEFSFWGCVGDDLLRLFEDINKLMGCPNERNS